MNGVNIPNLTGSTQNGNVPIPPTTSNPSPTGTLTPSTGTYTPSVATPAAPTTTSVQPQSPLATYATQPNSPSNIPSSSATSVQNATATSTLNATATNPTPPPNVAAQVSSIASSIAAMYPTGSNIQSSDIEAQIQAKLNRGESLADIQEELTPDATDLANMRNDISENQQNLATQASSYQSTLAQNNASFAAAFQKMQIQQQNDIAAQLGKLRSSGQANPANISAVTQMVNAQYAELNAQLTDQAAAAADQAATGNYDAVNKINASFDSVLSAGLAKIAANTQAITSKNATIEEQQATLAETAQNRATTQYNTSLSLLTPDASEASLFNSSGNPISGALTNPVFTNSSAYQLGTAAGLSPTAILSDMGNAIKTSKSSAKQESLQIEALRVNNASNVINSIASLPQPAAGDINSEKQYNSQIVSISGNSITKPSPTTTTQVTTLQGAIATLPSLYASISSVSGTTGFVNTVISKIPGISTNVSSFKDGVLAVAGQMDKALGSNTSSQLSQVLSAGDSPATRRTVYNILASTIANDAINTVTSAARSGVNMAAYQSVLSNAYGAMPTVTYNGQTLYVGQPYPRADGKTVTINPDMTTTIQ